MTADRELRYSASYGGWFWAVRIANPYPSHLPDGRMSILDQHIHDSGFCSRRKSAERAMGRAERRIKRRVAKAVRVTA